MSRVMIVAATANSSDTLSGFLNEECKTDITVCRSGIEARRAASVNDFDFVIVNTPLCDEFGIDLSMSIAGYSDACVMMIVKCENADDIADKVRESGVFVLSKPFSKPSFIQAIHFMQVAYMRTKNYKTENNILMKKIEDIRLVDRAKCVLIERLGMTEQQSHHYIERQAMDLRSSKHDVAKNIIKTYEN